MLITPTECVTNAHCNFSHIFMDVDRGSAEQKSPVFLSPPKLGVLQRFLGQNSTQTDSQLLCVSAVLSWQLFTQATLPIF